MVARSVELLQATLETNFRRFMNFLGYARNFVLKRNPLKGVLDEFVKVLKEMLTIKKKLKMSQYRLNYHRNQLQKMEALIAKNNEHAFLQGRNFNQVR